MRNPKFVFWTILVAALVMLLSLPHGGTASAIQITESATRPAGTALVPPCTLAQAPATPSVATAASGMIAGATVSPTQIATAAMTQEADAPLRFNRLEPFDVRFNPNRDKPFAVVMNFTLFFQNQLNVTLDVRNPQFQLILDGVPWGKVASTDFQMGKLQARADQGIVLQSLTLLNKATDAQKAVLDCIKAGKPIVVGLQGNLDTYPNDVKRSLAVTLWTPPLVLPTSN